MHKNNPIMKRRLYILFTLLAVAGVVAAQKSEDILSQALQIAAKAKVDQMQESIGFSDKQAVELLMIEIDFLEGVKKVNRRVLCNKKKRTRQLMRTRDEALQRVLSRSDYIKYDILNEGRLEPVPVQLNP